jgi:hypothetical protein
MRKVINTSNPKKIMIKRLIRERSQRKKLEKDITLSLQRASELFEENPRRGFQF